MHEKPLWSATYRSIILPKTPYTASDRVFVQALLPISSHTVGRTIVSRALATTKFTTQVQPIALTLLPPEGAASILACKESGQVGVVATSPSSRRLAKVSTAAEIAKRTTRERAGFSRDTALQRRLAFYRLCTKSLYAAQRTGVESFQRHPIGVPIAFLCRPCFPSPASLAQKLQAVTRGSGLLITKLPPLAPDPDFSCNAASDTFRTWPRR